MAASFFFYDLETSGVNAREARIMQFAGVRTDLQLKPTGEEHDYLLRLSDDTLPEPDAIMITGITPQKTISEGMHEAEFLKIFHEQIATPGTIFVGFNTVRFDDEFMRYLMYRNFYDAYEWQWQNERSRWDILDLVRMTRALRPDGIKWPFDSKGNPTNRLELLTSLNGLDHANAHDALSDVHATIAVAKMIRDKQPGLFDDLLSRRSKRDVSDFVHSEKAFLYSSGKFPSEFEKTTMVTLLADHAQGAFVYDLRHDPEPFASLSPDELAETMRWQKEKDAVRFPGKLMKFNRCPAIVKAGALNESAQKRIKLEPEVFQTNYKKLQTVKKELSEKVLQATELLDKKQQAKLLQDEAEVDTRLYDGFFGPDDKNKMGTVRSADIQELGKLDLRFKDDRLEALLPLYKARNYPAALTDEERETWEKFRERKLMSGGEKSRAARYFARLGELAKSTALTDEQRYLLEELQLYGQSILPMTD